jgi:hypothetical protein
MMGQVMNEGISKSSAVDVELVLLGMIRHGVCPLKVPEKDEVK